MTDSKESTALGVEDLLAAVGVPVTTTAPPANLRDRVIASRTRPGRYGLFADRIARFFDLALDEAAALLARLEAPDAWTPFLVEGTDIIAVTPGPKYAGAIATLVRIHPDKVFPEHIHRGTEAMFVLDGGFREVVTGNEVWRGEEITRDEGSEHALVGLPGVPCIAAALVVGYAEFR